MGKFKVGDKVKVINAGSSILRNGDIGIISLVDAFTAKVNVEGRERLGNWVLVDNLKLVNSKPSKKQRIETLEKEVSELKLIVHELRGRKVVEPSTEDVDTTQWLRGEVEGVIEFEGVKYRKVERLARKGDVVFLRKNTSCLGEENKPYKITVSKKGELLIKEEQIVLYFNHYGRTPETVDVYEYIVEDKPFIPEPIKTPNQLRAEIIEKAKGFVVETERKARGQHYRLKGDNYNRTLKAEYVINVQKRTIVVLIKGCTSGNLYARGIAKCNPSDVFNEHIGKAIALGRALGLDVSGFEGAVQPTVAIGQDIEVRFEDGELTGWIRTVEKINWGGYPSYNDGKYASDYKIINDTHAIYGEVE